MKVHDDSWSTEQFQLEVLARLALCVWAVVGKLRQAAADRPKHTNRGPVSLAFGFPRPDPKAYPQEEACDWTVTYDVWMPSFDKGEYEPVSHGGVHCLVACCADPTCLGLAMESIERYQCYKYSRLPKALSSGGLEQRALGDGQWLAGRPAKWSVFVKHARPGFHPSLQAAPGASSSAKREDDLDASLRSLQALHTPQEGSCPWMVHYDRWLPSFDGGEYEGVRQGGAHCLEVCCKDASCLGIAMESSELYQCYKYSKLPLGLEMQTARNLSNGVWLLEKKPAWSIFIKGGVQLLPGPTQAQLRAPPGAMPRRTGSEGGGFWPWRVLQVILVVAAFFLAHRLASSFPAARFLAKLRSGASSLEAAKLLPGAGKVPL